MRLIHLRNCLIVLLAVLGIGCRQDSLEVLATIHQPVGADTLISFSEDLMPLLMHSCSYSGCHDGSNRLAPALRSYAEVRPMAEVMTLEVSNGTMPIGSSLSEAEIRIFEGWLDQGALNN